MAPSTVSPAGTTAPADARLDPLLDPLAEALDLQDRVRTNPREAADGARALLARPRLGAEARTVAQRTLARSLRALDRPHDAVGEARRAAATARRAGLAQREAEARITLSLALFQAGRARVALEEIERAEAVATGHTALLASAQHGTLLERLGRLEEALARYSAALAGALPDEDRLSVLNNRAIALAFTGRVDAAVADLDEAIGLARKADAAMPEAELIHNLGFVLTVAGDLPAALARFDEADARFMALGAPIGLNLVARARALLRANLHREARLAATWAVDALEDGRAAAEAAEARVLLATAELADADPEAAIATAEQARRALHRQGRPGLAAQAEHVVVRARVRLGRRDRRTVDLALRCADALREAGLVAEELDARLTAALTARLLGDGERATACLDLVRSRRRRGPLLERSRAWHAEAVHRLDGGHRGAAGRAVEAGLDAVAGLQALMGSTELRVGAAGHGAALAELGLRIAVDAGDAWGVLRLLDQWRGASLDLGTPEHHDDELAGELAALRAATARLDQAAADGEDPAAARRAVAELEVRVRARARRAGGAAPLGTPGESRHRLDRPLLRQALGEAALLVYFELDGRLGAVAVRDGRARLTPDLGASAAHVDGLIGAALFAMRRLARSGGPAAVQAAALRSLEDSAAQLDHALLAPLLAGGRRPDALVVCPTGPLHALPWALLPSCDDRPVSVVPALRSLGAASGPLDHRRVVLAAGPELPGALAELAALSTVYPSARVFGGSEARVDAVLAALEGADVAHLACHGTFRVDNPMFSSLRLADGMLTVFDLEKLRQAPRLVVLAACDVGTAAVSAGDELLGLAAALQRAGADAVVASLVPVADETVVAMMVELHRGVAAGRSVAGALAAARAAAVADHPAAVAARASFACFGLR